MPTEQPNELSKMPEDSSDSKRSPHILLIEDDEEMLNMLSEALMQEGYRVTKRMKAFDWILYCIHNAGENMSFSPDDRFDAVVSDIRMPKMGGLEALRIINALNCAETCPPAIFITAFGDDETHRMAEKLGDVEVLDKPFDVNDLIKKVQKLISSQI
ncbi:Transcriptional regulatory protein FixJ [Limihaloglobus sulfuriphilus]|uniref:Transcriptional regulatory protein FixJ n=1 Tax=Limihaloglobus sulfuriphilus TaxID=1851148 RepID=A0A1Q2MHU4_9BACT|nr:response regulator [Limihaloglobus sulfuriphilus]AQQ71822.1 Transcriptional regulatory protein FixJ [Limihaloglobus sulfuriphilus]